jgi:hypothetical protein
MYNLIVHFVDIAFTQKKVYKLNSGQENKLLVNLTLCTQVCSQILFVCKNEEQKIRGQLSLNLYLGHKDKYIALYVISCA